MWFTVSVCVIAYLLAVSIDIVSAVKWPQCGEFVFPMDDTNLSAEEKQFRRKLPSLFESYDCGNASELERTLKSLEKYKTSLTSDKNCFAKQTLAPSHEIVSMFESIIHIGLKMTLWIFHRPSAFKAMDILHQLIRFYHLTVTFYTCIALVMKRTFNRTKMMKMESDRPYFWCMVS